jgi:hypothetical protein
VIAVVGSTAETVTLVPNPSDDQEAALTITGDFSGINVGPNDIIQLIPASGSPVTVSVISVGSITDLVVATRKGQAAITAETMDVQIPEHLVLGRTTYSATVAKQYLDVLDGGGVNEYGQIYSGSMSNGFTLDAAHGDIVTGSFTSMGNGYDQIIPSYRQDIETAGGTINPPTQASPLNASIDFPLITTGDSDLLVGDSATTFCTQSISLTLDNGLDPTTCLGRPAPQSYTLGTFRLSVSLEVYLSNTSYDSFMAQKLSLEPISFGFAATNRDGGYYYRITAAQLSFPDPASDGQDSQTMINAEGTSLVGPGGISSLYIYKLLGDQ